MKKYRSFLIFSLLALTCRLTSATQADDTTITIGEQNPGATALIKQLTLQASDASVIRSIRFTITPKPGSVTRPLSGKFANSYLTERGYLNSETGEIFLPIYGLYPSYDNQVVLTYDFMDGSSKQDSTTVTTDPFVESCGYDTPTVVQARTDNTALSYDYIMVKGSCSTNSPGIIDTDGALRWVGAAGIGGSTATFFDNAAYQASGSILYRIDLDGTVTVIHDYADIDVTLLHHNIDRGKFGLLLEADTTTQVEATVFEVDPAGNVLKFWDMAQIISDAMIAGGDDPAEFVSSEPDDWFHSNATTYSRADDTVIISSRESFVIALDYETSAIKWILGDPTKKWHEFPSLTNYAFTLAAGSLPPIGQHAISITFDQNLLLLDNGFNSSFYDPPGDLRDYAAPRKYHLDMETMVATEIWNYENDQSVNSPICGAVYEDAPYNYLVNYAYENGFGADTNYARILGLDASGEKVFDYRYPTIFCAKIFNAIPLHLESTAFPTVGPMSLNLSARGMVGLDQDALIGGFIVAGTAPKRVVLRALGPSLNGSLSGTLADPVLDLYDASGAIIATNDSWESDPGMAEISASNLAPGDPAEAATVQSLAPGAYTFVVRGKDLATGISLVEAYDVSPESDSTLPNISTRGLVGTGDNVLIGGFIVGDVASATVVIRALGPSLEAAGLNNPLPDPTVTVYDGNGAAIANNDNWAEDASALEIEQNGLAPTADAESATLLNLPAGAYTTITSGTNGSSGTGLVEVYNLE